jgi:membrane-bound lytic murein transglycosylase A
MLPRLPRLFYLARFFLPVVAVLALDGCTTTSAPPPAAPPVSAVAQKPVVMGLTKIPFVALPGWGRDHPAAALPPFRAGCAEMTDAKTLGGQGEAARLGGTGAAWRASCLAARAVPAGDDAARSFFERFFQPYAITADGSATGLFTGYYEPQVRGSLTRGGAYTTPLLARPNDIVEANLGAFSDEFRGKTILGRVDGTRFIPYYDRAAISGGALAGRHLELLWLADAIDGFFLEIQGSGRVVLPDGGVVRVTYAGQNGRPYVAIGRVLIDRGAIPRAEVSLQSIRAWLMAHPAEAASVMDANPSYVFFRELSGTRADEGPPGALGAGLTPGRSMAVDRAFLPLGAPIWLDTTDPLDGAPIQRLMLAQDTGGAIKGPVRGDVFWGWGPVAEARAGKMKSPGAAFVLLPREESPTLAH